MSLKDLGKDSIFIPSGKNPLEGEADMWSSEDESHCKKKKKAFLKTYGPGISLFFDTIGTLYEPDEDKEDDGRVSPLIDYKKIAGVMCVCLMLILSVFVFAEMRFLNARVKNLERKLAILEGGVRFPESPLSSCQWKCGDIQPVIDKLLEAISLASRFSSIGEKDNPSENGEQPMKKDEGGMVDEVGVDSKEEASPSMDISTTSPIQVDMNRTETPIQRQDAEEQGKSIEKEDKIIELPEPDLSQRSYNLTEVEEMEELEKKVEEAVKSEKYELADAADNPVSTWTLLSEFVSKYFCILCWF